MVSRLLPGDRIHDVAPINAIEHDEAARLAVVEAAELKRQRKQRKRAAA